MIDYLRIMLAPYLPERDDRGASAVEYGLLVAGIAMVIILAVWTLGGTISEMFGDANEAVTKKPTSPTT